MKSTPDLFDRALIRSMGEILFLCGSNKRAVVATLSVIGDDTERSKDSLDDEVSELKLVDNALFSDRNNVCCTCTAFIWISGLN